jgi:hypothetical protein
MGAELCHTRRAATQKGCRDLDDHEPGITVVDHLIERLAGGPITMMRQGTYPSAKILKEPRCFSSLLDSSLLISSIVSLLLISTHPRAEFQARLPKWLRGSQSKSS